MDTTERGDRVWKHAQRQGDFNSVVWTMFSLYKLFVCVCVCYDCYIQTSEWSQVGLWTLFSLFKEDLCDAFHFSGLEFFLILHAHFCIFSFLGKEEPPLLACLFCSTQHKWDPSGYFFLPLVLGFGYLWFKENMIQGPSSSSWSSIRFFAKSCTFA